MLSVKERKSLRDAVFAEVQRHRDTYYRRTPREIAEHLYEAILDAISAPTPGRRQPRPRKPRKQEASPCI